MSSTLTPTASPEIPVTTTREVRGTNDPLKEPTMKLGTMPIDLDLVHAGNTLGTLTIDIPLHADPIETHEDGSQSVTVKGPTAAGIERAIRAFVTEKPRPSDSVAGPARYLIQGILRDLEDGKRIGIVGPTLRASKDLLHEVIESGTPEAWSFISRSNGREHAVHHGGGTLFIVAASPALRGRKLDSLLVLDRHGLSGSQLHELDLAIGAVRDAGGEIQLVTL